MRSPLYLLGAVGLLACTDREHVEPCTSIEVWFDQDGDGFGGGAPLEVCDGEQSAAQVRRAGDCDDADDMVHPDAVEVCNERDDDCSDETPDVGVHLVGAPENAESIQAAIDAADPKGATIEVCAGTYDEDLWLEDRVVSIVGLEGSGETTIIGSGTEAVVVVGEGATLALSGFTVSGGSGSDLADHSGVGAGGGIHASAAAAIHLDGVLIEGNTARNLGGGVYGPVAGETTIRDSVVRDNTAVRAGGMYLFGSPLLENVEVIDNDASSRYGGIVIAVADPNLDPGIASLTDCLIDGNEAYVHAGGLALTGGASAELRATMITNNTAHEGAGGGLYVIDDGAIELDATSSVEHNESSFGGGVYLGGTLRGGSVTNNAATQSGGGIYAELPGPHGLIENTAVEHNTASSTGGGLYVGLGTLEVRDVGLTDNDAVTGGGFYVGSATVTMSDCDVLRNDATTAPGGLGSGDLLSITNTDWGSGTDDNVGNATDFVFIRESGVWTAYDLDLRTGFTCRSDTGCTFF